ncbi:MAG: hypothetical protein ACOX0F_08395 [Syntrophomonadaceae bacterium]|jgi:Mg/Co/Ni transporter MgtE
MGNRILTIFLLAVILSLMMPLTQAHFTVEPAFTVDNLVSIEMPSE